MINKPGTSSAPYAGFGIRFVAFLVDAVVFMAVLWPMLFAVYGMEYWQSDAFILGVPDFVINYVLPAVATIVFWMKLAATPGKLAVGIRIVDATTGEPISFGKSLIRYLGYYVSAVVFLAGYFWIAFDPKKQGWHDKMANTVVVGVKTSG